MVEIKQEFKSQYNQTLEKFIEVCEELLYIHLKQSSAKDHANEEIPQTPPCPHVIYECLIMMLSAGKIRIHDSSSHIDPGPWS